MKDSKFTWLILSVVIVVLFELLSFFHIALPPSLAIPFFLVIILAIGWHTLYEGLVALLSLNFKSINLLMLIAVSGAFYLGKYVEAAVVIVLYNLAERLEDLGIAKSQSALNRLIEKIPKLVFLKNRNTSVPIEEVKEGEIMVIKPFEIIPLDGVVVLGSSTIDESTMTGEPIPKDKMAGDMVYAGTLNNKGYLEVQVQKKFNQTTMAKILDITKEALENKALSQQFIETFAQYYTPGIILLALFWSIIPPLLWGIPFNVSFLGSLTLLVIACPCALVISTPISIYAALGNSSSQGVLIKGGRAVESLGQIKAMALDKTRTLTYGKPRVTDVIPFGNSSREDLLSCAAGIEAYSEHPLSQSILEAAEKESMIPHQIENFKSFVGMGAQADCMVCDEAHHCIGKLEFILAEHHVPQEVLETIDKLQQEGKTVIVVSTHKEIEGVIGLLDELRPDSYAFIESLRGLNVEPILLTGDHKMAAEVVGRALNIKHIESSLLPDEKAAIIKKLQSQYKEVGMVGDGINDAPALATASVGITMSDIGSSTAIEASSIVILEQHLKKIPFLINLARRTNRTIRFNIFLAICVKALFIALALIGFSSLVMAIFADVGVTLLVIFLSLRLMK